MNRLARIRITIRVRHFSLLTVLTCTLIGCTPAKKGGLSQAAFASPSYPGKVSFDQVRGDVMSFSDNYVQRSLEAIDTTIASTDDPVIERWCRRQRISVLGGSLANASSPNPMIGMLDMIVSVTLRAEIFESHWAPTLFKDQAGPMLEAERWGKREAWRIAENLLTTNQQAQLRELIQKWKKDNPDQYYVAYLHLTDFNEFRQYSAQRAEQRAPGSIFSLLYMDPLANLDPVAAEIQNSRLLFERLFYVAVRIPPLLAWQMEQGFADTLADPQVTTFNDSAAKFSAASESFARSVMDFRAGLSDQLAGSIDQLSKSMTVERTQAVDQVAAAATLEREAAIKQMAAEIDQLRTTATTQFSSVMDQQRVGLKDDLQAVVEASSSVATARVQESAERLIHEVFNRAMILLITAVIGVMMILLTYFFLKRRSV
jgi:hypothetical protein